MNYLVTGGTGFIGCYAMKELLARGENVTCYDLGLGPRIMDWILTPEEQAKIRFVTGDITDSHHLERTIKEQRVERIVHLAAFQIPACNANPPLGVRINCQGMVNVLEAARLLGVPRVVWASSVAVFGPPEMYKEEWVPNDAPHLPGSVYGATKSFCEFLASFYTENYGVETVGFRFSGVYGVGRLVGRSSFTTAMIEAAALGKPYTVPFGDDDYDWQYVEDVASVLADGAQKPMTKTRVFNTAGDVRPVREGVEYLKRLVPDAQLTVEPGTFGIVWKYDTTELQQELGFKPRYSMEEGVLKTLNEFRRRAGLGPISGA